MGKSKRIIHEPMPTLRAWRDGLRLSRAAVANIIRTRWPSMADAEIYGTSPDRLLFNPGDNLTPHLMQRAHHILTTKDKSALDRWLSSGTDLPDAQICDLA